MRELAQRVAYLDAQVTAVTTRMRRITTDLAPVLVATKGVGPDTAATLLITAGDNPDRLRHEKSFAALTGVSPIPVTAARSKTGSGSPRRRPASHSALWRIAIVRLATDPDTRAYVERRQKQGKTKSEAIRCLKRYIAREVFNALPDNSPRLTIGASHRRPDVPPRAKPSGSARSGVTVAIGRRQLLPS